MTEWQSVYIASSPPSSPKMSSVRNSDKANQSVSGLVQADPGDDVTRLWSLLKPDRETMLLIVGEEGSQHSIHVPRELLCQESDYFQVALRTTMTESKHRSFEFFEDSPYFWAVFIHWLYRRRGIVLPNTSSDLGSAVAFTDRALKGVKATYPNPPGKFDNEWTDAPSEYRNLIFCYILGDFLQSTGFKDQAATDVVLMYRDSGRDSIPTAQEIRYAFEHTPQGSKLRQLLLDIVDNAWGGYNCCQTNDNESIWRVADDRDDDYHEQGGKDHRAVSTGVQHLLCEATHPDIILHFAKRYFAQHRVSNHLDDGPDQVKGYIAEPLRGICVKYHEHDSTGGGCPAPFAREWY